jgi:hypothetical protein
MSQELQSQPSETDETIDPMDQATAELSTHIENLCKKYNAEFIVHKVVFSFLPKQLELPPSTEV